MTSAVPRPALGLATDPRSEAQLKHRSNRSTALLLASASLCCSLVKIAVLTPMSCPALDSSGPPLFPAGPGRARGQGAPLGAARAGASRGAPLAPRCGGGFYSAPPRRKGVVLPASGALPRQGCALTHQAALPPPTPRTRKCPLPAVGAHPG